MHVRDNVRASRVIHALCGSPFIYIMCVRATSTTTTLMGSRRSQLMEHGRPRRSITRPRRVLWIIDAPRWTQNSNRQMFVAARAIAFGWLWRRDVCQTIYTHITYTANVKRCIRARRPIARGVRGAAVVWAREIQTAIPGAPCSPSHNHRAQGRAQV